MDLRPRNFDAATSLISPVLHFKMVGMVPLRLIAHPQVDQSTFAPLAAKLVAIEVGGGAEASDDPAYR
jgi:hypothetical protein